LLIGGCIGSISSCSSREDGGTTEPDGKIVLNISPNIIEDEIITLANTETKSGSSVLQNSVITKEQMSYGNDFDALVEITASSESFLMLQLLWTIKLLLQPIPEWEMVLVMLLGFFRIMRGAEEHRLALTIPLQLGTPPKITVDGGTKYQWYAFSSNEATVPAIMIAAGKSLLMPLFHPIKIFYMPQVQLVL
jgi:hypothetical protein